MTIQVKNKIRGFILLLVFSLNLMAGFACSIGLDLGYNEKHHEHKSSDIIPESHAHSEKHHNDHGQVIIDVDGAIVHNSNDDCCSNGITEFMKLDKSVAGSIHVKDAVMMPAFISRFDLYEQPPCISLSTLFGSVMRSWHFNDDTDLRIVIQSFQI